MQDCLIVLHVHDTFCVQFDFCTGIQEVWSFKGEEVQQEGVWEKKNN